MTKKDYELIAKVIFLTKCELSTYQGSAIAILNTLRDNLGNKLQQENSRFDINKFFKACGDEYKDE